MSSAWWKEAFPHAAKSGAQAPARRDRWWDTSSDEALFWPEEEHIARARRMEQLERSLDELRGIRRRPLSTG
jgi:hypothetical protein